jgi:hypothetical protein
MGLIAKFNPGSIQCVDDMVRALEMVMLDLFSDVLSSDGRCGDSLEFTVRDAPTDDFFNFKIEVINRPSKAEAKEGAD